MEGTVAQVLRTGFENEVLIDYALRAGSVLCEYGDIDVRLLRKNG